VKAGKLRTFFQLGGNQFEAPQHEALPLVWSPDSNFLAARSGWPQKKVRILDVTTGKQTREWDGGPGLGSSNAMAWDSISQKLATCLGNPPRIRIWNVTTGEETLALDDPVLGLHRLNWSPDGRRLAYQADKAQIHDFSTRRTTSLAATAEQLLWNSDGSRLALVGNGSFSTRFGSRSVEFYDAATATAIPGEQRAAFPEPSAMRTASRGVEGQNYEIQSVVWNEHGMRAAATAMAYPGMGIIVVWDVRTGKPLLTLGQIYDAIADRAKVARMVSWAPDSRSLATLSGDSSSDAHAPIAWSPDGKRLAWGGPKPAVWNVASGKEDFPLAGHSSAVAHVEWSPDGRRVLSRCEVFGPFTRSFELKVWDAATAQEVLMLRGPMAGWRLAPGFQALASPPGVGSDPGDVVVWDLAPRK
jgi:WD40 repeat protein